MKLHELKKVDKTVNRKRVGRGISAGGGKTAGRGTKGQNSRSGHNIPRKFEGGQTPLAMRLHKLKGFKSLKADKIVVTLDEISKNFKAGETVSSATLMEKGLLKKGQKAKVLNTGTLTVAIKLAEDVSTSESVLEIINKPRPKADQPMAEKVSSTK
ncbi:MAG: 50S ribosomal protein L15 [Candidatus Berkelbacteria bacterium]|nr:50S ribosomal protein L15 [Candidatus Berkelbacteria bacterium]